MRGEGLSVGRGPRQQRWRVVGNELLRFEDSGKAALEKMMAETDNRALSDRAWRILHLRQGEGFIRITEEQDAAAHKLQPWLIQR